MDRFGKYQNGRFKKLFFWKISKPSRVLKVLKKIRFVSKQKIVIVSFPFQNEIIIYFSLDLSTLTEIYFSKCFRDLNKEILSWASPFFKSCYVRTYIKCLVFGNRKKCLIGLMKNTLVLQMPSTSHSLINRARVPAVPELWPWYSLHQLSAFFARPHLQAN